MSILCLFYVLDENLIMYEVSILYLFDILGESLIRSPLTILCLFQYLDESLIRNQLTILCLFQYLDESKMLQMLNQLGRVVLILKVRSQACFHRASVLLLCHYCLLQMNTLGVTDAAGLSGAAKGLISGREGVVLGTGKNEDDGVIHSGGDKEDNKTHCRFLHIAHSAVLSEITKPKQRRRVSDRHP